MINKIKTFFKSKLYLVAIIFSIIQLFVLSKVEFIAWPEMNLWPYLVLKGWLPYKDIAIVHTPLLILFLSVFNKIFGVGISQLKYFTWAFVVFSNLTLFFFVKKLLDQKKALFALFIYIPLLIFFQGNGLWFDLALAPLGLLIYFFLTKKKYLFAGIFFFLAVFTKQTAVWFSIPIIFQILESHDFSIKKSWPGMDYFLLGLLIPTLITLLTFWVFKFLPDFIFWAIKFGVFYLPHAAGQIHFPALRELLVSCIPFLFLALYIYKFKKKTNWSLVIWTIVGILGVYPRWEWFHYQPSLPFLALIISITFFESKEKIFKYIWILIFLLFITALGRFIYRNWGLETRFYDSQTQKVVSGVKGKVKPNDQIQVINYWDNIYPLTNTLPSFKPWIPYLSWYLKYPSIEKRYIYEITTNKPLLIVQGKFEEVSPNSYEIPQVKSFINHFYSTFSTIDQKVDILLPNK
jgi:hypothetical protein